MTRPGALGEFWRLFGSDLEAPAIKGRGETKADQIIPRSRKARTEDAPVRFVDDIELLLRLFGGEEMREFISDDVSGVVVDDDEESLAFMLHPERAEEVTPTAMGKV